MPQNESAAPSAPRFGFGSCSRDHRGPFYEDKVAERLPHLAQLRAEEELAEVRAQQYWLAPSKPNGADGGGGRDADIDLSILTRNAKRLLILRRNREKTVQLPPRPCYVLQLRKSSSSHPPHPGPAWRLCTSPCSPPGSIAGSRRIPLGPRWVCPARRRSISQLLPLLQGVLLPYIRDRVVGLERVGAWRFDPQYFCVFSPPTQPTPTVFRFGKAPRDKVAGAPTSNDSPGTVSGHLV